MESNPKLRLIQFFCRHRRIGLKIYLLLNPLDEGYDRDPEMVL